MYHIPCHNDNLNFVLFFKLRAPLSFTVLPACLVQIKIFFTRKLTTRFSILSYSLNLMATIAKRANRHKNTTVILGLQERVHITFYL